MITGNTDTVLLLYIFEHKYTEHKYSGHFNWVHI